MTDQKHTVIYDIKGLLQHSLHRGKDPDGVLSEMQNKSINTANFGLINFFNAYLLPTLEDDAPVSIIAVWDAGNDLRRAWFDGYKKKRSEREKDPVEEAQYDVLYSTAKSMLAGLGVTQVSCPLTEADDVIALLVRQLPGNKTIYSVDADMLQLQGENDNVQVFLRDDPMMEEKYKDVPLNLIRLHKSMVGDKSDEYNGVPGFGGVAWKEIIDVADIDGMQELEECVRSEEYQPLLDAIDGLANDGAYTQAHKALVKLYNSREDWQKGYRLASFHPDACYRIHKRQIVKPVWFRRVPSAQRVFNILHRMGMADLYEQHFSELMPDQSLVTLENIEHMFPFFKDHCNSGPLIGFDFETYDTLNHEAFNTVYTGRGDFVDVLSSSVTGASFTFGENLQYTLYVSVDHADTLNVDKDVLVQMLECCDPEKMVVQNANFEVALAKMNLGFHIESPIDTRILSHYLDEDRLQGHGLKGLSKDHLAYDQESYQTTLDKAGAANMRELTGEQVLSYGCDDAITTANLAVQFIIDAQCQGAWESCREHEFSAVHPLVDGFIKGVNVDMEYLAELAKQDAETIRVNMLEIRRLLSVHCAETSPSRPLHYYEAEREYLTDKFRGEGLSDEDISGKLTETLDGLVTASKYIPQQEVRTEVKDFIPTKVQFKKITDLLDYIAPILQPNPSGITKWLVSLGEKEGTTPDQLEFESLVASCAHQLRARKGEEYDLLVAFCNRINAANAPVQIVGDELNFDSPIQNVHLLYCKLGLPVRVRVKFNPTTKRAKLGFGPAPATDDKAMETAMAEDCANHDEWKYEVLKAVRTVKGARTRFSLYYNPWPVWVHPRDGLLHPQIINCGTVTRRPSGTSPNFLQITKKDGGRLRRSIKGLEADHVIISPDWAGQELRILASECKDETLMSAYLGERQLDVHSITAAGITPAVLKMLDPSAMENFSRDIVGIPYEEFVAALHGDDQYLTKLMKAVRSSAKAVNFLINYLGSASTLSRNLGIPKERAKEFMDMTFARYPGIKPWQNSIIRFAQVRGFTQTAYGSRRHMSDLILSEDSFAASRMHRQAVNAVVQGCAADILKRTLSAIHKQRVFQRHGASLIAPVYDEMAISTPITEAKSLMLELDPIMRITPPGHAITMVPEHCVGTTWGSMIELGAAPTEEAIDAALAECGQELGL
jgi:DNA polymerase I-like protein with 3'-5' exonuclease and polymerase domains/5'-3' exonuclease